MHKNTVNKSIITQLKILKCKQKDCKRISKFLKENLPGSKKFEAWWAEEEQYNLWMKVPNHYAVYKCIDGKNLLGVCVIETMSRSDIDILALAVDKKYRKNGVGKLLIKHVEKTARKMKKKHITLGSYKYFKVKNFYKKIGFVQVESDDDDVLEFKMKLR